MPTCNLKKICSLIKSDFKNASPLSQCSLPILNWKQGSQSDCLWNYLPLKQRLPVTEELIFESCKLSPSLPMPGSYAFSLPTALSPSTSNRARTVLLKTRAPPGLYSTPVNQAYLHLDPAS